MTCMIASNCNLLSSGAEEIPLDTASVKYAKIESSSFASSGYIASVVVD